MCNAANLSEEEALKTFNMGLGLVLIVDPDQAQAVCDAAVQAGEQPRVVGRVQTGTGIVRYEHEGKLL